MATSTETTEVKAAVPEETTETETPKPMDDWTLLRDVIRPGVPRTPLS